LGSLIARPKQATHYYLDTFSKHTKAAMSTNKDQTSTAQSYLDQATGAVQSALGSLTGSTADKVCSSLSPSHHPLTRAGTRREPQDRSRRRERPLARNCQGRSLHHHRLRRHRKRRPEPQRRQLEPERRRSEGVRRRIRRRRGPQAGGHPAEQGGQGPGSCRSGQ
jgi:hypothetical protein